MHNMSSGPKKKPPSLGIKRPAVAKHKQQAACWHNTNNNQLLHNTNSKQQPRHKSLAAAQQHQHAASMTGPITADTAWCSSTNCRSQQPRTPRHNHQHPAAASTSKVLKSSTQITILRN